MRELTDYEAEVLAEERAVWLEWADEQRAAGVDLDNIPEVHDVDLG